MKKQTTLQGVERVHLLNALYAKYGKKQRLRDRLTYWRKKYFWLIFVGGAVYLKRFLDFSLGLILLLLFLPFMFLIGAIIKISDGGPVFYVSERVGKWGKEFKFIKFRSMRQGADKKKTALVDQSEFKGDVTFKMKSDPRITPFGLILRKTSMDELPQLWNVIKGDMSLVGPRPPIPDEVERYTLEERRRLDVTPGITGIWQVSGRSDIPFEQQVQLDLQYIQSQSFWLDILLILKTIPAVLFGRGAY